MIEFGKSLRAARESKGLSIGQLSERTRMAPTTVQDLESENFSRIAAPIYGRGFVKLYCEAVGLEPKPFVDEFMEIFSGNRETDIRERPLPLTDVTTAEQPAEPEPPAPATPEPETEPDLFKQQPPSTEPPVSTGLPDAPLSRYAAPIRQNVTAFDVRAYLRIGILATIAIVTLTLIFFGLRAIYHATTETEKPSERNTSAESAAKPVASAIPHDNAPRIPQKIPSLYID